MRRWVWLTLCFSIFAVPPASGQETVEEPLGLAEAVRTVLQVSPLSEITEAGILAAEQGRKAARGDFLPKLRTKVEYTALNSVPTVEIPPLAPGMSAQVFDAGTKSQWNVTTTLEQPLFTGLGLITRYQIAELDQFAAEVDRAKTRQELILRTHEAYYGVLLAEKGVEVAGQAVTQLESHAEVARQFFETGMIPKNDMLKSLVQLAQARRRRIVAVSQLDLARSQLRTLLRWEERRPVKLREALAYRPYARSLDECIQVGLQHHPDLLLSAVDIRKATKGITAARSGFYPHLALVGGLLHEEGGFATSDNILSATLRAEWLVWEWGSNYYQVKRSESQLLQARAGHAQRSDQVRLGVHDAYIALEGWEESIEVAQTTIEQAEENYRITVEQYNENVTTSTEVLDAQFLQAQARMDYYSSLSNYNIAIARLEKAMGILRPPDDGP